MTFPRANRGVPENTEKNTEKKQKKCWDGVLFFSVVFFLCVLRDSAVSSSAFCREIDPGAVEDVQDVLFFHDSRPVLIRLDVLVDGKPYPARMRHCARSDEVGSSIRLAYRPGRSHAPLAGKRKSIDARFGDARRGQTVP